MQMFGPDANSEEERSEALQAKGPLIEAFMSNPTGVVGVKSSKRVLALVDTGATSNVIDERIAKALGLMQVDQRLVAHAMGEQLAPVFFGNLFIPKLEITITGRFIGGDSGGGSNGYDMLLGRSFLKRFILNYDGIKGHFTLISKEMLPGIVT